jgi:hypothetical protein
VQLARTGSSRGFVMASSIRLKPIFDFTHTGDCQILGDVTLISRFNSKSEAEVSSCASSAETESSINGIGADINGTEIKAEITPICFYFDTLNLNIKC